MNLDTGVSEPWKHWQSTRGPAGNSPHERHALCLSKLLRSRGPTKIPSRLLRDSSGHLLLNAHFLLAYHHCVTMFRFTSLPQEVLEEILRNLDCCSLLRACSVSIDSGNIGATAYRAAGLQTS